MDRFHHGKARELGHDLRRLVAIQLDLAQAEFHRGPADVLRRHVHEQPHRRHERRQRRQNLPGPPGRDEARRGWVKDQPDGIGARVGGGGCVLRTADAADLDPRAPAKPHVGPSIVHPEDARSARPAWQRAAGPGERGNVYGACRRSGGFWDLSPLTNTRSTQFEPTGPVIPAARVKAHRPLVDEPWGNSNFVNLTRGNIPTSALDAAAPATPGAAPHGPPLLEVPPADTVPAVEASACLTGIIEVQAELAAVGLDAETIMRVAAERAD